MDGASSGGQRASSQGPQAFNIIGSGKGLHRRGLSFGRRSRAGTGAETAAGSEVPPVPPVPSIAVTEHPDGPEEPLALPEDETALIPAVPEVKQDPRRLSVETPVSKLHEPLPPLPLSASPAASVPQQTIPKTSSDSPDSPVDEPFTGREIYASKHAHKGPLVSEQSEALVAPTKMFDRNVIASGEPKNVTWTDEDDDKPVNERSSRQEEKDAQAALTKTFESRMNAPPKPKNFTWTDSFDDEPSTERSSGKHVSGPPGSPGDKEAIVARLRGSLARLETERDQAVAESVRCKAALRALVSKLGPIMDACLEAESALNSLGK